MLLDDWKKEMMARDAALKQHFDQRRVDHGLQPQFTGTRTQQPETMTRDAAMKQYFDQQRVAHGLQPQFTETMPPEVTYVPEAVPPEEVIYREKPSADLVELEHFTDPIYEMQEYERLLGEYAPPEEEIYDPVAMLERDLGPEHHFPILGEATEQYMTPVQRREADTAAALPEVGGPDMETQQAPRFVQLLDDYVQAVQHVEQEFLDEATEQYLTPVQRREAQQAVEQEYEPAAVDGGDWSITSEYGKVRNLAHHSEPTLHAGVDLIPRNTEKRVGTPIKSVVEGEVIKVANLGARGHTVKILDDLGNTHIFQHMEGSSPRNEGERVRLGDIIGNVGNSGTTAGQVENGAHLHYEVWDPQGGHIDPMQWLDGIYRIF